MNQQDFISAIDKLVMQLGVLKDEPHYIYMNQETYGKVRHTQRKGRHFRPHNLVSTDVDRFRFGGNFTLNKEYNSKRPHPRWDKRSRGDTAYSRRSK